MSEFDDILSELVCTSSHKFYIEIIVLSLSLSLSLSLLKIYHNNI